MKNNLRNLVMAAALASSATFASMPAANATCGLECWLSNTFSTNDGVGDWLRDTFGGGIMSPGSGGEDRLTENLRKAAKDSDKLDPLDGEINMIATTWKPGEEMFDRDTLAKAKPRCKLPQLIEVVSKTKSPEALIKNCF